MSPSNSSSSVVSLVRALFLGSVPAFCMLVATCIGLGKKVTPSVAGALQHFAAGVLLCTIGTELLPEMVAAKGWLENTSMGMGFFLGVAVLIFLGSVLEQTDDDTKASSSDTVEEPPEPSDGEAELTIPRNSSTPQQLSRLRQRQSLMATAFRHSSSDSCFGRLSNTCAAAATVKNEGEQQPLFYKLSKPFPNALVLAVGIDSALDGLLIGIASAAGPSAGPMMSASLSVEMSFLGLTLATALHGHAVTKSLPAAIFGPSVLILGAGVGGFMAATFSHDPVLFVGLLSFGTSALLFMVAEELLLEAHAEQGEHLWWVDLQLYTGFFASILAGKFMPET